MSDLLTGTHNDTMRKPLHVLVAELNKNLGVTLVAYMANVRSRQLPARWATSPGEAGHSEPRDEAKKRLQLAAVVFTSIEKQESDYVARQWLIGANPRFRGQSPAERIREDDAGGVFGALESFLHDGGSGGA